MCVTISAVHMDDLKSGWDYTSMSDERVSYENIRNLLSVGTDKGLTDEVLTDDRTISTAAGCSNANQSTKENKNAVVFSDNIGSNSNHVSVSIHVVADAANKPAELTSLLEFLMNVDIPIETVGETIWAEFWQYCHSVMFITVVMMSVLQEFNI